MENSMDSGMMIRRSAAMLHSEINNETVMIDMEKGLYYALDDIGSRIWALADQPIAMRHLCDRLTIEYAVSPEQCREEVAQFLEELLSNGIVEIVAVAAGHAG